MAVPVFVPIHKCTHLLADFVIAGVRPAGALGPPSLSDVGPALQLQRSYVPGGIGVLDRHAPDR